jgi:hypothetical protein
MKTKVKLEFERFGYTEMDFQESSCVTFVYDEDEAGLTTVLEKIEIFLTNMGFVLDGQCLDVVDSKSRMDTDEEEAIRDFTLLDFRLHNKD